MTSQSDLAEYWLKAELQRNLCFTPIAYLKCALT